MKYRNMGKYGLKLSEVSLGGWLTYGNTVEQPDAFKCIHQAFENGVNFIDVADIYARGKAEEVVGKVLKEENQPRKNLVVSSKVFWPMTENPNDVGLSRKHIMDSIDSTLERLGLDYLDIYFCHRYDYDTPLEETILAMDDLIRSGKIHYWGTSVWSPKQLERAYGLAKELGAHPPAVEQPRYNMLDRFIELELFETVKYHGMGIVVWSPLAQGLLTGKYNNGIPDDSRAKKKDFMKFLEHDLNNTETMNKLNQLGEVANELNIKMSQLALAWILHNEEISSVITGATKPNQVQENVKSVDVTLKKETIDKLENILGNKPVFHGPYRPA
ncbi:MAG: aldo/keto reductase family protein [Candidatus Thorarchaeota archaeon]